MKEKLVLTEEWDKVFPKNENVNHKKVTFVNHFGITVAADIMSTKLHFYDKYDGKVQFDAKISLGDLLRTINQPEFINSILNDNQNFSKHTR